MPNPLCSYNSFIKNLTEFYGFYSKQFFCFFEGLSCWENLNEQDKDKIIAVIKDLPENAVENYKKQYFELTRCFKDFAIWTNQQDNQQLEEEIDVGFKKINKSLSELIERSRNEKIVETLNKQSCLYIDHVSQSIIKGEAESDSAFSMSFPSKCDIFVPQQFQAISYHENMKLESEESWKNKEKRDNISEFIAAMLHHPDCNTNPLIILGLPGAGKSLLCNMLAAKILHQEYHVVIVTLRNARADDTIQQQVSDQIKRDLGAECSWFDISSAKLNKPLLIIFDGYDELLQSSGKTYSSYINDVSEFQRTQLITSNMSVKCIITSRTVLIDKAYIPNRTTILKLCDFDETRIKVWSNIWNDFNKDYFKNNNLKEFSLPENSKICELAHQPLLLMMLALYDSIDNKLDKQKDLTQTQLYNNLILDFVLREKKKNKEFNKLSKEKKDNEINEEIKKLGIAAIGMYNRNMYHIGSNDLNLDITFYKNVCSIINNDVSLNEDGLTEAEKLLGSFFFMYKSLSTDYDNKNKTENVSYEFLHNTFGEFLTARFIFSNIFELVEEIIFSSKHSRRIDWKNIFKSQWYSSLIYIPLFYKPVVISMLKEWSQNHFLKEKIEDDRIAVIIDEVLDVELKRIIQGDIYIKLNELLLERDNHYPHNDLLYHISTYSINLIILRSILSQNQQPIKLEKSASSECLCKLINLWKYAFKDDDLLRFSHLFSIKEYHNSFIINYSEKNLDTEYQKDNKLEIIYDISAAIGDSQTQALSGCVIGNYNYRNDIFESFYASGLNLRYEFCVFSIIGNITKNNYKESFKVLKDLVDSVKNNDDYNNVLLCLAIIKILSEYCKHNNYYYTKLKNQIVDSLYKVGTFVFSSESFYKYHRKYKRFPNLFDAFCEIICSDIFSDDEFCRFINKTNVLRATFQRRYFGYWEIKCVNKYLNTINRNKYSLWDFDRLLFEFEHIADSHRFDDYRLRERYNELEYILSINEILKLYIWVYEKSSFEHNIRMPKYIIEAYRHILSAPLIQSIFYKERNKYEHEFVTANQSTIMELLSNSIILYCYYCSVSSEVFQTQLNNSFDYLDSIIHLLNHNNHLLSQLYSCSEKAISYLFDLLDNGFEDYIITQSSIDAFIEDKKDLISVFILKKLKKYCIVNKYESTVSKIETILIT